MERIALAFLLNMMITLASIIAVEIQTLVAFIQPVIDASIC
jgi:hypothetical protein